MKHMVKRILFKKEEEEKNGMTINAVQALPCMFVYI